MTDLERRMQNLVREFLRKAEHSERSSTSCAAANVWRAAADLLITQLAEAKEQR